LEKIYAWFDSLVQALVALVEHLGVLGIFIMTFLESTFLPIPSEITMIPAGYLVQQGKMDLMSVFIASVIGTVGGAYLNYWIAKRFGRGLFLRYGRYFFMTPEKLVKLENFFNKHGAVSTFTGRLIPGLRHFISFPAGLAKMDLKKFFIYTSAGGAIWMATLLAIGYYIGKNEALAAKYMPMIKLGILVFVALVVVGYIINARRKAKRG
jgi:membrane protein DedA with SNARE-associated domain